MERWSIRPTGFRAEAKGLIGVVVFGGRTPSVSIVPANSCASVVRLPLEGEGELTSSTVSIATQGEEHCKPNKDKSCIFLHRQHLHLRFLCAYEDFFPAPSESGAIVSVKQTQV